MNRNIRRGPVSVTRRGVGSPVRRAGTPLTRAASDSSANTDSGCDTQRSSEEDEDPGNDVFATGQF
jgi:hypothetical protein